jgi:hypothetical protein
MSSTPVPRGLSPLYPNSSWAVGGIGDIKNARKFIFYLHFQRAFVKSKGIFLEKNKVLKNFSFLEASRCIF